MRQKIVNLDLIYWLAFFTLALWATFAYFTMHSLITAQQQYGPLINLSGKQRMLSQKIALQAHLSMLHGENRSDLRDLLERMRKENGYILKHLPSEAMRDFYLGAHGLQPEVERYFGAVESFLKHHGPTDLEAIERQRNALLERLDKAVYAFEAEHNEITASLKRRELFIYIGTLLTLMLEALFIIRPMMRRHKDYLTTLEAEVQARTRKIELYRKIFRNAAEGMIITDLDQRIVDVNRAFTDITGYKREEVIGQLPQLLSSGMHSNAFYAYMWSEIHSAGLWQGAIVNKRKDGSVIHEHLTIFKIADDVASNYVCVFSDITKQIEDEKQLQFLATHDTLTTLPNRGFIVRSINEAIEQSRRDNNTIAVVFIDLDNFKTINDAMGHQAGDRLLVEVARRLQSALGDEAKLGRVGGDEFVILVESFNEKANLVALLEAILERLGQPLTLENRQFVSTASIGVVVHPELPGETANARALLRKADIAMYEAKDMGKNRYVFYDHSLEKKIESHLLVETALQDAIETNTLQLYYQPKFDLYSARCVGAEVLLRWEHEGSFIPPDRFIPVAEESNMIFTLDRWVFEQAIGHLTRLKEHGLDSVALAINVSAKTFSNPTSIREIIEMIRRNGHEEMVGIEITEGALLSDMVKTRSLIGELRRAGIELSLDDFGTGYSSLAYLSQLEFDTIKIDRSFIWSYEDPKQRILTEGTISFCKQMGFKLVAEGVETLEQLKWLQGLGCDYGQGYYHAKPMPFDAFVSYLRSQEETA